MRHIAGPPGAVGPAGAGLHRSVRVSAPGGAAGSAAAARSSLLSLPRPLRPAFPEAASDGGGGEDVEDAAREVNSALPCAVTCRGNSVRLFAEEATVSSSQYRMSGPTLSPLRRGRRKSCRMAHASGTPDPRAVPGSSPSRSRSQNRRSRVRSRPCLWPPSSRAPVLAASASGLARAQRGSSFPQPVRDSATFQGAGRRLRTRLGT